MNCTIRIATALSLIATLSFGQNLIPVSQTRVATANANVDDGALFFSDSDHDQASDFAPFVSQVNAMTSSSGATGTGGGYQDSSILPDSFLATGSCNGTGFGTTPWQASGSGESSVSLVFDVVALVGYEIHGRLEGYDQGYAEYYLFREDGSFVAGELGIAQGPIPILKRGYLEPGRYTYQARAYGGGGFFGSNTFYAFSEFELTLSLAPLTGNYCVGSANSAGPGAILAMEGIPDVSLNQFGFRATGLPSTSFGILFYGPNQVQVPFGDGFRCVGGQVFRATSPLLADASGAQLFPVDFTSAPASSGPGKLRPFSTWNFQAWYRDAAASAGSGFNLSDAAWVDFFP